MAMQNPSHLRCTEIHTFAATSFSEAAETTSPVLACSHVREAYGARALEAWEAEQFYSHLASIGTDSKFGVPRWLPLSEIPKTAP